MNRILNETNPDSTDGGPLKIPTQLVKIIDILGWVVTLKPFTFCCETWTCCGVVPSGVTFRFVVNFCCVTPYPMKLESYIGFRWLPLAAAFLALHSTPSQAQNIWNGGAGTTNWSTGGNWSF